MTVNTNMHIVLKLYLALITARFNDIVYMTKIMINLAHPREMIAYIHVIFFNYSEMAQVSMGER